MNERIKELISLCRDVDYIGFDETVHYSFNEEKFAELIVKECMSIVSKSGNSKAEILNDLEEFIWSTK